MSCLVLSKRDHYHWLCCLRGQAREVSLQTANFFLFLWSMTQAFFYELPHEQYFIESLWVQYFESSKRTGQVWDRPFFKDQSQRLHDHLNPWCNSLLQRRAGLSGEWERVQLRSGDWKVWFGFRNCCIFEDTDSSCGEIYINLGKTTVERAFDVAQMFELAHFLKHFSYIQFFYVESICSHIWLSKTSSIWHSVPS